MFRVSYAVLLGVSVLAAGATLAYRTAPSTALLIMIEGQATFSTGSEKIAMKAGTVVHIPSTVEHRIDAISDSHFVLVR